MQIKIENLSFRYKALGAQSNAVLEGINLEMAQGEFLALVGPSGSGKTTLMQHFTRLLQPDAGRVLIDGRDLADKQISLTHVRRQIGLVFQFPEAQLFEETVYDDVAFAPRNLRLPKAEVDRRVRDALAQVGLDFEQLRTHSPMHLSDGEKRRLALAGVLAMQPACLVLDEPTAGLDSRGTRAIMAILKELHAQGKTILLISHNLDLVVALVHRIVVINQGRIVFDGHKTALFENTKLLQEAGLALPRIVPLAEDLRQKGWIASKTVFSVEELKKEVDRVITTKQPLLS